MSENPVFDPTRSSAIREILYQTVANDAVTRRRHLRFMFIAILTAVAVALAGGTAALALSGLPPFGPPAPAPSIPAPTVTPSPTPTPTPTPQPVVPSVQVSTIPVVPHDVNALPSQPGWSLDLPGTGEACEQHAVYTIADGLALFQVGSKVTAGDRGDPPCNPDADYESLTLVNTRTGGVLWTREWNWTHGGDGTQLLVLGTSGRALITSNSAVGPSEVFDLGSGKKLGAFTPPRTAGEYLRVQSVQDASGDVVMGYRAHDSAGALLPYSEVSRFDPLDVAHPKWTTKVDASTLGVDTVTNGSHIASLQYIPTGTSSGYVSATIDLRTGAVSPVPGDAATNYYSAITVRTTADAAYTTQTITGYDDDGVQKWARQVPYNTNVSEVMSSSAIPGRSSDFRAGTTFLVIGDAKRITLIDERTGDPLWTADASGCGLGDANYLRFPYQLTSAGNAIVLNWGDTVCSFSTDTGARIPSNGIPVLTFPLYGVTNVYTSRPAGVAWDSTSGAVLWRRPVTADERWVFAGGYLVSVKGNHVELIG